jgi:Ulp1 family protease
MGGFILNHVLYRFVNYNDRVFIYKNDLKCLRPEKWLNDSIMEYCYTEMHRAALAADRNKASNIHISNSFFYTRMQNAKT